MTALPYRTTTQRQSLTTMVQTERAAKQGPAKLRFENYVFVKIPQKRIFGIYYVKFS